MLLQGFKSFVIVDCHYLAAKLELFLVTAAVLKILRTNTLHHHEREWGDCLSFISAPRVKRKMS